MDLSSPESDSFGAISYFWQSWYNCNVYLGGREYGVQQQTSLCHSVHTLQGSETGRGGGRESLTPVFYPLSNNLYLSEMPLGHLGALTPLSTVVRVMHYKGKQLAHSRICFPTSRQQGCRSQEGVKHSHLGYSAYICKSGLIWE